MRNNKYNLSFGVATPQSTCTKPSAFTFNNNGCLLFIPLLCCSSLIRFFFFFFITGAINWTVNQREVKVLSFPQTSTTPITLTPPSNSTPPLYFPQQHASTTLPPSSTQVNGPPLQVRDTVTITINRAEMKDPWCICITWRDKSASFMYASITPLIFYVFHSFRSRYS